MKNYIATILITSASLTGCLTLPDPAAALEKKMIEFADYDRNRIIDEKENIQFLGKFAEDNNLSNTSGRAFTYTRTKSGEGNFLYKTWKMPLWTDSLGKEISLKKIEQLANDYKPK